MAEFAADYVDVASRLVEFRTKHPEGSLQPARRETPFEVIEIGDAKFIVYGAAAYRTPDDPRPGIGYAYEPVPGKTPYTRNSELQNAETSAWGRAIQAALAADARKGIASQDEVRNRRAEQAITTNPEWFALAKDTIYKATTLAALEKAGAEIKRAVAAGEVSDSDKDGLADLYRAAEADIRSANQAEPDEPTPAEAASAEQSGGDGEAA